MLKCNAEFVDLVFGLMFETFWVPPYDRRRRDPVLVDFSNNARHTSLLLSSVDLATASPVQLHEMQVAVTALMHCIGRLGESGLFPAGECDEALAQVRSILDALPAKCGV